MKKITILITGAAGFVGFHVAKKLLSKGYRVIGVDNLNNYYDVRIKKKRLEVLKNNKKNFLFFKIDISKYNQLLKICSFKIDYIFNFAAQAGVRHSLKKPDDYFISNIVGFYNILKISNKLKVKHLFSASTSSVYGVSNQMPLSVKKSNANLPIQFYAGTKRCNEIMGISYANAFSLSITFFRFFTLYGPWGRPDMSLFKFVKNIINKKKIYLFNNGKHFRDFTYIDDAVNVITYKFENYLKKSKKNFFEIINIGSGRKISLVAYVKIISKILKTNPIIKYLDMQKGDVYETLSDINENKKNYNHIKFTNINIGILNFINWYKSFFNVKK